MKLYAVNKIENKKEISLGLFLSANDAFKCLTYAAHKPAKIVNAETDNAETAESISAMAEGREITVTAHLSEEYLAAADDVFAALGFGFSESSMEFRVKCLHAFGEGEWGQAKND